MQTRTEEELTNAAIRLAEPIINPVSRAVFEFKSDQMRFPENYVAQEDKYRGRLTIKFEGITKTYGGSYFITSYGEGCKMMIQFDELVFVDQAIRPNCIEAAMLKDFEEMISYLQTAFPRPEDAEAA